MKDEEQIKGKGKEKEEDEEQEKTIIKEKQGRRT